MDPFLFVLGFFSDVICAGLVLYPVMSTKQVHSHFVESLTLGMFLPSLPHWPPSLGRKKLYILMHAVQSTPQSLTLCKHVKLWLLSSNLQLLLWWELIALLIDSCKLFLRTTLSVHSIFLLTDSPTPLFIAPLAWILNSCLQSCLIKWSN